MKVERKCSGRCLVVKFCDRSLADKSKLGKAARAVRKKLAFIQVKGAGSEETLGIVSRMIDGLYSGRINIFGIFTITSCILFFVDAEDVKRAVKLIRKSIKAISHTMKSS